MLIERWLVSSTSGKRKHARSQEHFWKRRRKGLKRSFSHYYTTRKRSGKPQMFSLRVVHTHVCMCMRSVARFRGERLLFGPLQSTGKELSSSSHIFLGNQTCKAQFGFCLTKVKIKDGKQQQNDAQEPLQGDSMINHIPLHHGPDKTNSGHGENNPSAQRGSSASKAFCKKTLFHANVTGCCAGVCPAPEVLAHLDGCKAGSC